MDETALLAAYQARRPLLDALVATLQQATAEALDGVAHIDRIAFRAKEQRSFVAKAADPKYTHPLSELEDQVAGRVITSSATTSPWYAPH